AARTATKYGDTPTIPSSLTTSRPDRTRRPSDNANTRARPSLRRHVLEHLATGSSAPARRNSRLSPVRWRARNKLGSGPINDPQAGYTVRHPLKSTLTLKLDQSTGSCHI